MNDDRARWVAAWWFAGTLMLSIMALVVEASSKPEAPSGWADLAVLSMLVAPVGWCAARRTVSARAGAWFLVIAGGLVLVAGALNFIYFYGATREASGPSVTFEIARRLLTTFGIVGVAVALARQPLHWMLGGLVIGTALVEPLVDVGLFGDETLRVQLGIAWRAFLLLQLVVAELAKRPPGAEPLSLRALAPALRPVEFIRSAQALRMVAWFVLAMTIGGTVLPERAYADTPLPTTFSSLFWFALLPISAFEVYALATWSRSAVRQGSPMSAAAAMASVVTLGAALGCSIVASYVVIGQHEMRPEMLDTARVFLRYFTRFGALAAFTTITLFLASIWQLARTPELRVRTIAALIASILAIVFWMGWGAMPVLAQTKALRVGMPAIVALLSVVCFALLVSVVRALEVATRAEGQGEDLKTVAQRYV